MGGRGRSRRTQRKHFRDGRENVWKDRKSDSQQEEGETGNNNNEQVSNENGNGKRTTHWQPFATQNHAFDEYYKEQGVVGPEEWDAFNECLRKPLPAAFRINSSSQFCMDIRSQLQNEFMKSLQAECIDANEADGIKPLPWYPDNLAWHSSFSRMQLRKNKNLERFHEFLKQENEIGNITRQEAVSMVPPLFLDVRRDHFVLDMCAAPGSKTFQLLEMIHQASETGSLPSGMIIANDVDVQRCNLLIHQTKRMCTANLIVTNHEAQHFPSCHLKKNLADASELGMSELLFDRVLCDVPCSGDGTLRKAPDIWRKWSIGMGNGVHCLQVQIAMRGLALLKTGGRMVYSTCSMNPVENEAVVSEILQRCGDSVELVDVSSELPQLIRRPGLKSWKVRDKAMWFASYKDAHKNRRDGIVPSMFPSGQNHLDTSDDHQKTTSVEVLDDGSHENSGIESKIRDDQEVPTDNLVAEVSSFPLERCMRFVPHDQDTGAFFIAVLHKISPLPVFQTKSSKLSRQLHSKNDEKPETLDERLEEGTNGTEVDMAEIRNEQSVEATPDADMLDNESDEAVMDTNPCKKLKETETDQVQLPKVVETCSENANGKRKSQIHGKWKGVDPVVFFNDDAILTGIKEFYGIEESFPFTHHLITRNSDTKHVKRIYYISESVKNILELNFQGGEQLKITSIGLKMFERQTSREGTSSPCVFRISSEGLPLLLPYMTKQIACASPVDFKHLLQYKSIKFPDFVDAGLREKVETFSLGCCVVVLNRGSEGLLDLPKVDQSTIAIGAWKGRSSISVMVTAIDCQELLERLVVCMETEKKLKLQEAKPNDHNNGIEVDNTEAKEDAKTVTLSTVS